MRIPRPWPAPKAGEAFPAKARFFSIDQEIALDKVDEEPLVVIDLFTEEGLFVADWEAKLWDIQRRYPGLAVVLQVTALPPALIFPDTWGLRGYLVHGPTWVHLHELSLPAQDPTAPYEPWAGWHLISPHYEPPQIALHALNTFLQTLQDWRRTLLTYQPQESSLFYTAADRLYTHFSLSELNAYVASIRR